MNMAIPSWLTGAVAAIILSAAARALPVPAPSGSQFYRWFYRFTQNLLANFDKTQKA